MLFNLLLSLSPINWCQSLAKRAMLSLFFLAGMVSCASSPKARAVQVAMAADAMADTSSILWDRAIDNKIEGCRAKNLETEAERRKCMGFFGEENRERFEALLKGLIAAQTAIYVAATCEDNPLKLDKGSLERLGESTDGLTEELRPMCVDKADWQSLLQNMQMAWVAIKPFIVKARGAQ